MSEVIQEDGRKPVCKPFKRRVRSSGTSALLTVPSWAIRSEQVVAGREYEVRLYEVSPEVQQKEVQSDDSNN